MQLLVRFPNWIGDATMATPILERLGKVAVVAKPHIQQLLQENPHVLHFHEPGAIPKNRYDIALLLTNSFSSAWESFRAGISKRIGFCGDYRSLLLTDPISFPHNRYTRHLTLTYQALLSPLGYSIEATAPRLFISDQERDDAARLLGSGPLVGFHTNAAYGSAKCWPKDRFQRVAEALMDQGIRCVFFGAPSEVDAVNPFVPQRAVNLCGETSLRQLMASLSHCDVVISNDSGPMHIADAVGTPVISLFGSTDPIYTGPFSNMEYVVQKKVACAPCFRRECPIDFRCMRSIEEQDVIKKTVDLIETISTM